MSESALLITHYSSLITSETRFRMSNQANQPATNRPLTTADVSPPDAVPEGVEAKTGGFRVPTDTLRAYTMIIALVAIWLFFQWKTVNPLYPYGIFLHPN